MAKSLILSNVAQLREKTIVILLIVLFAISSCFTGEWNKGLQAVILVFVFLIGFFALRTFVPRVRLSWKHMLWTPETYLAIFLLFGLASIFFSVNLYLSASQWLLLAGFAVVYFVARELGKSWQLVRWLAYGSFWVGVVYAIIAIAQFFLTSRGRISGLLFNANATGSYLVLLVPLGVALVAASRSGWRKTMLIIGLVIVTVTFLLTYSYTGWVSLFLASLLIVPYVKRFVTKRVAIWGVVAVLVMVLGITGIRLAQGRDFSEAVRFYQGMSTNAFIFSFGQRLNFIESAIDMAQDHPMFGTGLNTFQAVYSQYALTVNEQPRYAHNYYLQTAAEIGILGVAAFIAFLVLVFWRGWRAIQTIEDTQKRILLTGVVIAALASALHALFDFGWHFPAVYNLFWVFLGIVAAHARQSVIVTHALPEQATVRPHWRSRVLVIVSSIVLVVLLARGVTVAAGAYYLQEVELERKSGELSAVYDAYEQAYRFDPDPQTLANYAEERMKFALLIKPEDYQWFEQQLEDILRRDPEYSYGHWVLGRLLFQQDKLVEARQQYQLAVTYNPLFRPDYHYDLAFTYFEEGEYDQAGQVIDEILGYYPVGIHSSNPNLPTQLAFLKLLRGQIYKEQDRELAARYYYEQALLLKPDLQPALEQLNALSN